MNQELEKNKYFVERNVLSKEILQLCSHYYYMKFIINKEFTKDIYSLTESVFDENGNFQRNSDVVRPFSVFDYSDTLSESILVELLPRMKEITGIPELFPTYSFARFYENGQYLVKHKDRPSCQYSITLPVASFDETPWSIYVENNAVDLKMGDIVVYKGCEALHWREPFEGTWQVQLHLHYVDSSNPEYVDFIRDRRPSIGLKPIGVRI